MKPIIFALNYYNPNHTCDIIRSVQLEGISKSFGDMTLMLKLEGV